jgi:uncharacterized protein (DUF433 family)
MERQKVHSALSRRLRLPAYSISQTAELAQTRPQTVTRWFVGDHPVFATAKEPRAALSYLQLVEMAFASSFRSLGVSLQRIRRAHDYLASVFKVEYPFAQLELKTDGLHIIKELEASEERKSTGMILADRAGQEAWPPLISDRIAQFDYEMNLAMRWHPRGRQHPVVVDPRISFGAPVLESTGIATWVLRERFEAGESLAEICDDFGVSRAKLKAALQFEGLQAAA